MDDSPTRRRLLAGLAAGSAAGLAGCSSFIQVERADETVERTFDAADVSRLRVEDAADDVALDAADGDTLRVRAKKRAVGSTSLDDLGFETDLADGVLTLTSSKPDVFGIGGGSVDLGVEVPEGVVVERVATRDGDIAARGIGDDPALDTGDGDVTVAHLPGDLTASTGDGDVTVSDARGTVAVETGDGDVAVRSPGAVRSLRTGDGDVVATVPSLDGDAEVGTGDGDITLELGPGLDARIEATTGDGRVTVAGGLSEVETATETAVVGTVGSGDGSLVVHSGDGDIVIKS